MTTHKWEFPARFRRNAFGWRSDLPVKRIREAVSEIKKVARKQPELAAEGAITLIEKLSPALMQVDSSSGALGSAVNKAIDTLVPIIAKADVDTSVRQGWLNRLWQAIQDDEMPYIESLAEYWGELCVTPELASQWADEMLPGVQMAFKPKAPEQRYTGSSYFAGTPVCLSAMMKAGRNQELLDLLETSSLQWWHYRKWGVQALVAEGKKAEAIRYAEASRGLNDPDWQIAQVCEQILLSSGMADEAYERYALPANLASTNLARFRALTKKYPHKSQEHILRDLIASTPGQEGKWFAAAKDAGQYALALELVERSPTDPRTLIRAARDYAEENSEFALRAGIAALHWISQGYGYELTLGDIADACDAIKGAADAAGLSVPAVRDQLLQHFDAEPHNFVLIQQMLTRRLTDAS